MKAKFIGEVDFICEGIRHKHGMEYEVSGDMLERYSMLFEIMDEEVIEEKAEEVIEEKAEEVIEEKAEEVIEDKPKARQRAPKKK